MSLVVDSSIAVKWYVQETWHEETLEIADREVDLLAPDVIVAEVTNAAWKKALRGEITHQQAVDIAAKIGSGTPGLCESSLLNEEALRIGLAINHPVHDCLYTTCDQLFEGFVVTDDQRLCQPWRARFMRPLWRIYRRSEPP